VTVDEYIAAAPEDRRGTLAALRDLVRSAVPDAVEEIRHRMPYYAHHGDLCAFAAQKNYFSFYVMSGGLDAAGHRDAREARRRQGLHQVQPARPASRRGSSRRAPRHGGRERRARGYLR
jgi:hypothetical protein